MNISVEVKEAVEYSLPGPPMPSQDPMRAIGFVMTHAGFPVARRWPIRASARQDAFMKLQDLDLHLLRAFDALLREKHVTRAAERLGMSQSSMSVSLAKLRDLFGDELLMRSGSGWMPTELALVLWPRVQDAIGALERVLESPSFDAATATTTFRLIVIDYIDLLMMPAVMRRIRQEAPGVKLHVLQTNPHHFGEMMAAGELDLALTYFPGAPDYLKGRKLFSDRFLGLCASSHPVLSQTLDVGSFCALPHVTIELDAAQIYNVQIDAALEPHGLRRRVQMIKPSFLALPFVLETSDMVASVPARLARRMTRMATVSLFDIPLELPLFDVRMLWHPRTDHSPAHEWLRDLMLACAREA
ncbi:nodulation protein D 2 [Variovorax paradoxus]|uniref:Nodulation protein D 2 n=1 Tax=Variovorax paradoxus TaxID=34073 RepID=A0A0H2LTL9_VARPD|nr:LysR family transcriptional regulator [Variovorax paradoxus]KLN53006.1 nodulation protein D 2 [Variovorax paradoxus]